MSDPEKAASIFDVLYADTRRLSSLLSQFSDDGLVTEIVRAASDTTTTGAGLSLKIFKADTTEAGATTATTRIDPQWLLPLLFLDHAKDLIQRDITAAAIGSLVLATGRLVVTDLNLLHQMWNNPVLKKALAQAAADAQQAKDEGGDQAAGNRHDRRAAGKQAGKPIAKPSTSDAEAILEMLPMFPHVAQANIVTQSYAVWSTLEPANLIGSLSDLVLKHGAKIAGQWSVVGILDGRPFEKQTEDHDYDDVLGARERMLMGMGGQSLWKVATDLGAPIRQALGRPVISYGVTPLIIFREIGTP